MAKIFGTAIGSCGAETKLNIAYGDTPPSDTSKLWIRGEEPANIKFLAKLDTSDLTSPYVVTENNIHVWETLSDDSLMFNVLVTDEATIQIGVLSVWRGNSDNWGVRQDAYLYHDDNWYNINTSVAYTTSLPGGDYTWFDEIDDFTGVAGRSQALSFESGSLMWDAIEFRTDGTSFYIVYLTYDGDEAIAYSYNGDEDECFWDPEYQTIYTSTTDINWFVKSFIVANTSVA